MAITINQTVDSTKAYLVAVDIDATATGGTSVSGLVSAVSGANVDSLGYGDTTSRVANVTVASVVVTVGDGTSLSTPITVSTGDADVVLDAFTLTSSAGGTVDTVTVTKTGTAVVSAVDIYSDANGNGSIDVGDVSVGSGTFGSAITINQTLSVTAKSYLVVADIGAASDGSSVTGRITLAIGTGIDAFTYNDTTSRTANVQHTIANVGDGAGLSTPVNVSPGDPNVVVDTFTLAKTQGLKTPSIATVTVSKTGTALVSAVDIYSDANGNGVIDGADASVGSGTFGLAITINQTVDSTKAYLVAVDIDATATGGTSVSGLVTVATGTDLDSFTYSDTTGRTANVVIVASDTAAPSIPLNIAATGGAASPIIANVTWDASTDNVAVTGYRIWRSPALGGPYVEVGTSTTLSFADTTGVTGKDYWYMVSAYDAAANESDLSDAAGPAQAIWTGPAVPHASYSFSTGLCKACHVPHEAASNSNILRETGENPVELGVCYVCHDSTGASSNVKSGADNSFALASGHSLEVTVTSPDLTNTCAGCHNPHRDYGANGLLPRTLVNGVAVSGANNTWCLACHNAANDWYGAGYPAVAAPTRDTTGYPTLGTFPGPAAYNSVASNPHVSIPASATIEREAGDCLYCHASHGSASAYDSLEATYQPTTASSLVKDQSQGDYAASCFQCHGTTAGGDFTLPLAGVTNIQQFVTAGGSRSGHRIKTAGGKLPVGSPLPCYDCHNPHGSARGNKQLLSDELGRSLETTSLPSGAHLVRTFCFSCHTTADSAKGWDSVAATYTTAIASGKQIQGLARDAAVGANVLRLPVADGHYEGDTQSCYACHGADYGTGGFNVHNPTGGESSGTTSCFACHTYQSMQSNATYHHYMASDSAASYPVIADPSAMTTGDARRTCLTCHVDHDYFVPSLNTDAAHTEGRAQNFRSSVANTPSKSDASTYVNYDYSQTEVLDRNGDGGVCTSCHKAQMAKNTTGRTTSTDRFASTVPVTKQLYGSSAHNYMAGSQTGNPYTQLQDSTAATYTSDSSGFAVNCGKCHNDTMAKAFQSGPFTFGLHDSPVLSLLTDNGQAEVTNVPEEKMCYLCHSRATDSLPHNPNGGDGYAGDDPDMFGGSLEAGAMMSDSLNVKSMFTTATITSKHPVTGDGVSTSRVECESCHNPHKTEADTGFGVASGVVQNPDNTLIGSAINGTEVYYIAPSVDSSAAANRSFCMKCHDGTPPSKINNGTVYVPYDVFIAPAQAAKADKSAYLGRSHANARSADTSPGAVTIFDPARSAGYCSSCHDRHGSKYPSLLGTAYDPVSAPTIAGTVITGNNNTVCDACHAGPTPNYPAATRDANGYPRLGTWPGNGTYTTAYVPATHTGSPHSTANGGGNSSLPAYVAGDCKVCHDVHGTANMYDETRLPYTPTDFDLCFDCHDTDGPAARNMKTYYPGAVGGSGGGSGHQIQTPTGSLLSGSVLPCYDCHNPHGTSTSSYGLLVVTELVSGTPLVLGDSVGEIRMAPTDIDGAGEEINVRNFCFACHTTGDTAKGFNGTMLVLVTPGAEVEGIDRTVYDVANEWGLRLPNRGGHREGDTLQSCFQCHGNDYSTLSSNNVHNPSGGVSVGGQDCYGCHSVYQTYMEDDAGVKTGASNGTVYHHVVGGTVSSTYYDGDHAFAASTYPTTTSEVFCLSCHVDHNLFNPPGNAQAANLRPDLSDAPIAGATTDWSDSTNTGVCSSCHTTSLTKSLAVEKKSDGRTATPLIANAAYDSSAHKYGTNSTYTDATIFSANCSKCHNDENSPSYKDFQNSTSRFGTHWSASQHIVSALGGTVADQLQETHCYRCHSATTDAVVGTRKTVAGRDWYNAANMTSVGTEQVYQQFQMTSKHPVAAAGGDSVECESCHNAHTVQTTAGSRTSDPDNTYTLMAYSDITDQPAFCLRCHDGELKTRTITSGTYIPYSITQASTSVNNKSDAPAAVLSKGHWTTSGSIAAGERTSCAVCHDNHGSTYPKLLGAFDAASSTNKVNGVAITGNNNTVCAVCHTAASTGTSYTRSGSYPTEATWPGMARYNSSALHATLNGGGNSSLPNMPGAGDCKVCHDVHGTTNTYDELRPVTTAPATTVSFDSDTFSLCFDCHDSSGPSTRNIAQYYTVANGGTATSGNAGHKIKAGGGTLVVGSGLPCYDCHNPHGTGSIDGLVVESMIVGTRYLIGDVAGEINMSTAAGVRLFCFTCHTTATGRGTSSAGTAFTNIVATDLVEGISRNPAVDDNALKLSAYSAHTEADTRTCLSSSCHGGFTAVGSPNVHSPSSGAGGGPCLDCHGTGSNENLSGMIGSTASYHHVLDGVSPDRNTYPTASLETLYCLSCHVDHANFNGAAGNLRSAYGDVVSGAFGKNTDFPGDGQTGDGTAGVCVSCHQTARPKDTLNQKPGVSGTSSTLVIDRQKYDDSKHEYVINDAAKVGYDGSSAFLANCVKCHDDDNATALETREDGTFKLAPHLSADARIAQALGATVTNNQTEEQLCYRCHTGVGSGTDGYGINPNGTPMSIASRSFNTLFNDAAKPYKHPVGANSGRHQAEEGSAVGWNPAATRHVECEDCHNVHEAKAGITPWPSNTAQRTVVPAIAGSNAGVWGVDVDANGDADWAGTGTFGTPSSPSYTRMTASGYQWQLCLKCHSSYSWNATPPTVMTVNNGNRPGPQTDVGKDFNPKNFAVHPVFSVGKNNPANATISLGGWVSNQWDASAERRNINGDSSGNALSNTFTDGWLWDSRVVCTDCHNNSDVTGASGPHASANRWLLKGVDPNIKVTEFTAGVTYPNAGAAAAGVGANFCLNCHRSDVYGYTPSDGDMTAATAEELSRFPHNPNSGCMSSSQLGTQLRYSGCLICHGARKDTNSYYQTSNTVAQSGAIHGTSMGDPTLVAGGDAMGYRFMNGASWANHILGDSSGTGSCYNFKGVTVDTAYSSCTQHSGKTFTPNYYFARPTN
ncbi:MAG: cytochrome c3 family protein [Coriobacteriia bacterium]